MDKELTTLIDTIAERFCAGTMRSLQEIIELVDGMSEGKLLREERKYLLYSLSMRCVQVAYLTLSASLSAEESRSVDETLKLSNVFSGTLSKEKAESIIQVMTTDINDILTNIRK